MVGVAHLWRASHKTDAASWRCSREARAPSPRSLIKNASKADTRQLRYGFGVRFTWGFEINAEISLLGLKLFQSFPKNFSNIFLFL